MSDIKCFIGMHRYCKDKEESVTDVRGNVTGKVIISICQHCGKVKATYIKTVE